MECCLYKKSQYVGKSAYTLNLRTNTQRTEGLPCDKHFQMPGNNFNDHAKFTIFEQVKKGSLSKSKIRNLLQHKENFWILKLQAVSLQDLNMSLNYPQDTTGSIW